jgi:hypothetical protein
MRKRQEKLIAQAHPYNRPEVDDAPLTPRRARPTVVIETARAPAKHAPTTT